MGKRKKESKEYWEKELKYIQSVDPFNNAVFRRDPRIFEKYAMMQARFAKEDGFVELSNAMLKAAK